MNLIQQLKDNGQDHEWYPTTAIIIAAIVKDLKQEEKDHYNRYSSILDIGAGNGKVLDAIKEAQVGINEFYAIEKSPILCGQLDKSIFVIGTAFEEQSLISKQVDVIFSNPPYSIFEEWTVKIIKQSAAKLIYLVIPERYKNSEEIKHALKFRGAELEVIGSFDFLESEDRKARAKVNLLKISIPSHRKDDAFDLFFEEQFSDLIGKFELKEEEVKEKPFTGLVVGENYPEAIVELYNREMAKIQKNYHLVGELDAELLKEFEVDPKKVRHCLKKRLSGLRQDYWSELFSKMRPITDRLTSNSRKNLLETLQKNVHVDFTVSNIQVILIWAIKNSNHYIDSQLISTYENMVDKANVILYKSNHKQFVEQRWRYAGDEEKNSHYALECRIVMHRCGGLSGSSYSWEERNGLNPRAYEFIQDLLTVANNLGFICSTSPMSLTGEGSWTSRTREFYFNKGEELLFDVKAFKNGNLHLRLAKKFALALNVEHGRLKGWLRSKAEAVEELQDPEAEEFFKVNHKLLSGNNQLLLAA